MSRPWIRFNIVMPADARGWIGAGCYSLVLVVLAMIAVWPALLENDAFLILATAIVITGWVNGPVGWAYQATKGGGEAAESSARIAEQAAAAALPSIGATDEPQPVVVMNTQTEPVPTTDEAGPRPGGGL